MKLLSLAATAMVAVSLWGCGQDVEEILSDDKAQMTDVVSNGQKIRLKSCGEYLGRDDRHYAHMVGQDAKDNVWTVKVVSDSIIALEETFPNYFLWKAGCEGCVTLHLGQNDQTNWQVEVVSKGDKIIKLKSSNGEYLYNPNEKDHQGDPRGPNTISLATEKCTEWFVEHVS